MIFVFDSSFVFDIFTQRFTDIKCRTPAPGAYNDPRQALETLKRISGMKKSPFGQTDVRFKPTRGTDAPGQLIFSVTYSSY